MVRESRIKEMKLNGYDLYTPEEAAELSKLSLMTVYRHITSGLLKARKVGGATRIERQDLETWLSQAHPKST